MDRAHRPALLGAASTKVDDRSRRRSTGSAFGTTVVTTPQRRSTTEVVDGSGTVQITGWVPDGLNEGRRPKSSTVHGDGAAVGEDDVASTKVDDRSRRRSRRPSVPQAACFGLNEGRRPKSSTVMRLTALGRAAGASTKVDDRSRRRVTQTTQHLVKILRLNEGRRPKSSTVALHADTVARQNIRLNEGRRPKSSTDAAVAVRAVRVRAPQRRSTTEVVDGAGDDLAAATVGGRSLNEGRRPKSSTVGSVRVRRQAFKASTKVDDRSRRRSWNTRSELASPTAPQRRSTTEVVDGVGVGEGFGGSCACLNEGRRPKSSTDVAAGQRPPEGLHASTKVDDRSRRRCCRTGDRAELTNRPQRRSTTEVVDGRGRRGSRAAAAVPQRRSTTEVVDGRLEGHWGGESVYRLNEGRRPKSSTVPKPRRTPP